MFSCFLTLHYLVVNEKQFQSTGNQLVQTLSQQLKENEGRSLYMDDPDCHWGVETNYNMMCPCCNIVLTESVSHDKTGVLLFKCGHGFHKFCLPDRECVICDSVEDEYHII